jgi:glycosyltransferase involved in cell wall biosynthesis
MATASSTTKAVMGRTGDQVLSAIICTYDRYDLLPEAIESLRRQDVAAGEIEIIVVDNSPDQAASGAFGQRYAEAPRLAYITEATPGLSNARSVAAPR